MKEMTLTEYREWANKILDLLPDAKAVAVDECGDIFWYSDIPNRENFVWRECSSIDHYIGYIVNNDDICPWWKESLVVRRWMPETGDKYFLAEPCNIDLFDENNIWEGYPTEIHQLNHNLIFKTKEEAIQRAKQMLGEEG